MKYEGKKGGRGKFPMVEDKDHDEMSEIDDSVRDSMGKNKFGPERHGIPEEDWPKKFVVDGGLKYDFGGPETHGVEHNIADIDERAEGSGEDIPGKTHEYDKSKGAIKSWPKKFKTDGMSDDFGGGDGGGDEY